LEITFAGNITIIRRFHEIPRHWSSSVHNRGVWTINIGD